MKKKALKTAALLAALLLIAGLGFFANALLGNPASKMLAERAAKAYLAQQYGDTDFIIDRVTYSFKDGGYMAFVKSPGSIDSYFPIYYDMGGQLKRDEYEDMVLSGSNTLRRLEMAYRELTDTVFESRVYPFGDNIAYGRLECVPREYAQDVDADYALIMEDLEPDRMYDIRELGAQAGRLIVYVDDETVSVERAAEVLLELRQLMDESGVPFHAIDLVLVHPRPEDGGERPEGRVEVWQFLYGDIYEDGLTERVKAANDFVTAQRAVLDREK